MQQTRGHERDVTKARYKNSRSMDVKPVQLALCNRCPELGWRRLNKLPDTSAGNFVGHLDRARTRGHP